MRAHIVDAQSVYLETVEIDPLQPLPRCVFSPEPPIGMWVYLQHNGTDWIGLSEYPAQIEPQPDYEALKRQVVTALTAEYESRVQALAAGYSQYERESWPVQTAEATAHSNDPLSPTPWLDAASAARGIAKAELAARVIAMDTAYRQIHGALTGHRQKLWDQINAAQTADELASVDVTAGWPT